MTPATRSLVGALLSIGGVSAVTGCGAESHRPSTLSSSDGGSRDATASLNESGLDSGASCSTLPVIDDYGNNGPFDTTVVNNTGPDGGYTIFRPATLGQDGFKHSPVTWGNGILTTPSNYTAFLSTVASHGFVVIGCNDTMVRAQEMIDGLDWLVAQNVAPGDYQGNIDTERLVTLGYSWGGMGSVNAGSHAKVVATVSLHGLTGASDALHGPLLLTTGTQDTFVTLSGYVQPTFDKSSVQTFLGDLTMATHLIVLGNASDERGAAIAWLRLWVCGDQGARRYFYGDDCVLCKGPWATLDPNTDAGMPQRKNWQ
jgi:hypothetical protein